MEEFGVVGVLVCVTGEQSRVWPGSGLGSATSLPGALSQCVHLTKPLPPHLPTGDACGASRAVCDTSVCARARAGWRAQHRPAVRPVGWPFPCP